MITKALSSVLHHSNHLNNCFFATKEIESGFFKKKKNRKRYVVNVVPREVTTTEGGAFSCSGACILKEVENPAQHINTPVLHRYRILIVPSVLPPSFHVIYQLAR